MANTFDPTWIPSYSSPVTTEMRVKKQIFGNGYSQTVKDGINNVIEKYDILFENITDAQLVAITAFILETQGVDWFYWTPQMAGHNTQKKFRVTTFKDESLQFNSNRLSMVFEQTFDS